jgi:hypothetical protein
LEIAFIIVPLGYTARVLSHIPTLPTVLRFIPR